MSIQKSTYPKKKPLEGQFFHSLSKINGKIEWQGQVIGHPEPGWYLIQLFDWLAGEPSIQRLVRIEDMERFFFYDTAELMVYSYDYGTARAGGPYREATKEYKP